MITWGRKIETRQLKIFVTVYMNGSFTKAADVLHTSQPVISEHIRTLEKRLGCRLFDRLGRSIKPTRKAEILYPKALSILEDIKSVEDELLLEDQNISGELIIGASTIPGTYLLPHIATDFKARHAGISFEITIADSGEVIDSVLNHELLIGVVGAKSASNALSFHPFAEDKLVLAAAKERTISSRISLQNLLEIPFLLRENGSGTRKSIEKFWLRNGLEIGQLNRVAVLGSNEAIKEAIKENLGVSILSRMSICDELECGKLKEIRIEGVTMKRSFYVATHKKRSLPNHYNAFLKRLLKAA